MSSIFYRGQFDNYKVSSLSPALESVTATYSCDSGTYIRRKAVFLSHKHDDLDDMKGVIGMLEREFNVNVYIDSMDGAMPKKTCGETASRIKGKINDCDKFILLATEGAIESKWCNWELGFGDAKKSVNKSIAIFPMRETRFSSYKGNEYLEIYPHIIEENGLSKYNDGSIIEKGYYVVEKRNGTDYYTPLKMWLSR